MVLTIPDFVVPLDIPIIINWFNHYEIADVKNVNVYKHPEQEYYVEDRPYYGYAVIEIREWYKNNTSLRFYENLIAGTAKIAIILNGNSESVWNVEFYEPRTQEEVYSVNTITQTQKLDENENENEDEDEDEDEDENEDEDYVFEETDEENDLNYEYLLENHHKMDKMDKMDKMLKRKRKENNSKLTKTKTTLNTENITLQELIIKKNKNYVKRNKRKPFKNEWNRRLRQKLVI